jgi:hypothetical protein
VSVSVPLGGVDAAKLSQPIEAPRQQSAKAATTRRLNIPEFEFCFFCMEIL